MRRRWKRRPIHMEENKPFDESLSSAARSMPEFDVPEKLTQNILNSVQAEQTKPQSGIQISIIAALAVMACAALVWNSFDSVPGWGSWFVGVAVLWGFKWLFERGG